GRPILGGGKHRNVVADDGVVTDGLAGDLGDLEVLELLGAYVLKGRHVGGRGDDVLQRLHRAAVGRKGDGPTRRERRCADLHIWNPEVTAKVRLVKLDEGRDRIGQVLAADPRGDFRLQRGVVDNHIGLPSKSSAPGTSAKASI